MNTNDYSQLTPTEIPNAEDYMEAFADMLEHPVMITELLAGQEWAATAARVPETDEIVGVIAKWGEDRARAMRDERLLYESDLNYMLCALMQQAPKDVQAITLRGVVIDPTVYEGRNTKVRLFDIEVDGQPLDAAHAFALFDCYGVPHVPVLSLPNQTLETWMNRRSIPVATKGVSKIAPVARAGVVFRPVTEYVHVSVGRLMLKAKTA